jgi:tetratricopeptide (TPR) repeat protein
MSPWIFAVVIRFWPLGEFGRLAEAGETIQRGIELAQEHGEHALIGLGLSARVIHDEWRGETATTLVSARQSLEIAEGTGVPMLLSMATFTLGDALRLEQRWQEALEVYQKALDLIRTKRVGLLWETNVASGQALVYSALGEHERAIARARSALEESAKGGNRRGEDRALLTLARVLLAAGDPARHDEVERTVERAETLCEETGMRVYLAPLLEVRACLAQLRSNPKEARGKLREAHRLFTEMGATGHAERLAKELKATKAPKRKLAAQKPRTKGKAKSAKPGKKRKPVR